MKRLAGLTQKEFFSVVGFLFKFVDADAPAALKNDSASMEYVISSLPNFGFAPPSKSTLQAVSSPLHWPAMLGVLETLARFAAHTAKRADAIVARAEARFLQFLNHDWVCTTSPAVFTSCTSP